MEEEEVTVMMIRSTPDHGSINEKSINRITTTTSSTTTTFPWPSWKLYDNPFYNSQHKSHHHHCQCLHGHNLHDHLPISSARKIAASFRNQLTFVSTAMETDEDQLDIARTQILELRAELEYERKARKKVETLNKRLAKELAEERRAREALGRVCAELAKEIKSGKMEINQMKRDMEEERKMLRMAEVFREERVQMKLAEAKILFEEKFLKLEGTKQTEREPEQERELNSTSNIEDKNPEDKGPDHIAANLSGKFSRLNLRERSYNYDDYSSGANSKEPTFRVVLREKQQFIDNVGMVSSIASKRKASPEPENPHIKRGIKGFVEFPRVVRAIGAKNRHWGTKLDQCQKSQLRILLKQKCPIRSNINLILS